MTEPGDGWYDPDGCPICHAAPGTPHGNECHVPARLFELEGILREAFKGSGRAIRRRNDPPLDGEPYMSMEDAVELGARAVCADEGAMP